MKRSIPLSLSLLIPLTLAGCDGRALSAGDGGLADARVSADAKAGNSCQYPNGTCDWDSDCPSDTKCVGAVRTTGIPHAFVCKGICQPKLTTPACDLKADPKLSVTLFKRGSDVIAKVTNVGCRPAYRMEGCCGEGQPSVQSSEAGKWLAARCSPSPKLCCDAEPRCLAVMPQQSYEVRVSSLSAQVCCGTTFRVGLHFSRNANCIDTDEKIALVATSNGLKLRDKDTCPPKISTPCGNITCAENQICVRNAAWQTSYHCKPVPKGCENDRSCKCAGKSLCAGGFSLCNDNSAKSTITCSCPAC